MNMNPQLAQQPQHLRPQFGSSNFPAPPFDHLQDPGPDRLPPLAFRNQRQPSITSPLAQAQQQRSFSTDNPPRPGFRPVSSTQYGVQYSDPAEHMLRRKTPNGTLAAGYDGTPVQWATKPPPLKHVLLPAADSSSHRGGPSMVAADNYSTRRANSLGWNYHNPQTQAPSFGHNPQAGQRMNSDPGNWVYLPSMQHQASEYAVDRLSMQQGAPVYPQNGLQIQVPTVLQPSYQNSPGPTALDNPGSYGPYWPDGNFVPYRPAAQRNTGHLPPNHNSFGFHEGGQFQSSNAFTGTQLPFRQLPFNVDSAQNADALASLDTQPHQSEAGHSTPRYSQHRYHETSSIYSPVDDGSRTPTALPQNRTNNAQFKERTLSWAHAIYVDLLAALHQAKKESRQARQAQGSRTFPKNSIYPKPPRQPGSAFGSAPNSYNSASPINDNEISPRKQVGASFQHTPRTNVNNGSWWQSSIRSNQDMPHYVSPFQSSYSGSSPMVKAKEALDMLTTLCEQSGWAWIDGMLLGGCLAYALEEHQEALDWYSKIIALDPKHVEAISNLAATLLCLNRREEAEQHWLQSVKLRPSYFEAVEHLIGLLCGDHRGTEAVNIIDFVERSLRIPKTEESQDYFSETSSNADRSSTSSMSTSSDLIHDFEIDDRGFRSPILKRDSENGTPAGFGSSGFSVPGSDNGRILALVHAKGNMLYALGDIDGASKAFEEAVLISAGRGLSGIHGLIKKIVDVLSIDGFTALRTDKSPPPPTNTSPLLLPPEKALQTAKLVFTKNGDLPGLHYVPQGIARKAAISTTSNSLLSLAKIFQDAMSNTSSSQSISRMPTGVGDILALYYLSLSLQPSPSTANNVGILLASVPQSATYRPQARHNTAGHPGVVPGSGVALAFAYYNYGLKLDSRHAHLYTNLGSLLKDIGNLGAAIKMYEEAVRCDSTFDIALANLANAVKDQGHTSDAIDYYRRAVASSPDFAEAVCGLANALNSVCDWAGRGGVILDGGKQDRWHVDDSGMITEALHGSGGGWMKRVVDIVGRQLRDGSSWGKGTLRDNVLYQFIQQLELADTGGRWDQEKKTNLQATIRSWVGHRWEGARVLRLVERATKRAMHRWYKDKYIKNIQLPPSTYMRPQLPSSLSVPTAPTVLPFHTFTCPLSAKEIRMISQRNALRISCSTLRAPWMQGSIFQPPPPPSPHLNIGYVSSDFNNHPLAHLMQSVFGMHNPARAKAFCYATTASDNSVHRRQIEKEAPVFRDVSSWAPDRLVQQIVEDQIHILVNLNGYTRGARNEVFAARPCPIQMSFMGFAGTLGAEWCDYILADETAIPPDTLRPWRRNIDLEDQLLDQQAFEDENWVYSENIIFCKDTFFCCDHAQSEPQENRLSWKEEQSKRWAMRKELFPSLSDDAIILGNFNQLYKIEPTTFRTWLRILDKVPKAILWLLRFPDLGESNLKRTALEWAGESVASRIWFTDVAPKHQHISRARVCDLFLDTPECNAHTTAADVLWSSTPLLTLPRYKYKMCSRMAASILKGALPRGDEGRRAAAELIAADDDQYEEFAIKLASSFEYRINASGHGEGVGRLGELRKLLYDSRWTCALFDTKRWVNDLEGAYEEAWRRWVANEGGDIYMT